MKKEWCLLLSIILSISLIGNIYLYNYWFDNEYPHGTTWEHATIIYFFNDEYDYHSFVDFDGSVYEIKNGDIKSKIYSSFDSWVKVNYSMSEIERYGIKEIVLTIDDTRKFSFEIQYHTYDRLMEGNTVHYAKTKVIDDFRISGWQS